MEVPGIDGGEILRIFDSEVWREVRDAAEQVAVPAGEVLFRQGDPGDGMYVVVSGALEVLGLDDDGQETRLAQLGPEDLIGEVQLMAGGRRSATVRAAEASELIRLSPELCETILEKSPDTLRRLSERAQRRLHRSLLASMLPELFGPLDRDTLDYLESQVEWIRLRRGDRLFEQGDPGDELYVLLSGRLAAVATTDGEETVVNEIGRGECLGEMALFTGETRSLSARALRDSVLVGFSKERFDTISARFPGVLHNLARVLVRRLARATPLPSSPFVVPAPAASTARTVALVPAAADVPVSELARRLASALSAFGRTLHLDREGPERLFGLSAPASQAQRELAQIRLSEWLDNQEARFRFVIYEAEAKPSAWTRRCLRQADEILVVAWAGRAAASQELLGTAGGDDDVRDRTALVLLHPEGRSRPRATGPALAALGLSWHHHLRWDEAGDCERLARFLAGRAVGLTLGGGGARGFAHIGVIRALCEAGIPIDMVGGTSMGALMAALYALCGDTARMREMVQEDFLVGRPQRDFTLPVFGLLSGRRPERLLARRFGDTDIEDLWIHYFAVSANLTAARQVIHRRGPVTRAVRASASVPGTVTPVLDGHELLVDGGVLNNLPGDVMRRLCGGRVILVDVSPQTDLRVVGLGERLPSPWKVLWSRLNPFMEPIEAPGMIEILIRSSTLASVQGRALAREAADLYLAPPVGRFGMFETTALDDLVEIGYRHAREHLGEWQP